MIQRTFSLLALFCTVSAFCLAQSSQTTAVTNSSSQQGASPQQYQWSATLKVLDPSKNVQGTSGAATKTTTIVQHPAVKKLQQHQNNKGNNKQK